MSRHYMRVRKVALMGANGLVAQRFQQRLSKHPWFELVAVYGSPRTVGMGLAELQWHLPEARPDLPELVVRSLDSIIFDVDDFEIDRNNLKERQISLRFPEFPKQKMFADI